MGHFLKSKNCEYILVAVDYVSKWVEDMPCKAANAMNSKKMFEETIFPRFEIPRMVISDGHFTNKNFHNYLLRHGIRHNIATPYHLRQVAKQKHRTNKSRIFYRRRSTRWGLHGRIDYPMCCGHTEWPINTPWDVTLSTCQWEDLSSTH